MDYDFDVQVLRGKMAEQLASNTEQFLYVLTEALDALHDDEMNEILSSQPSYEADLAMCATKLRGSDRPGG